MSTVRHSFVSPKADPADTTLVRPSDWNADHEEGVEVSGAVGDGVTDDTTAIHSARDSAGAGGKVYFPGPATYLVSGLAANVAGQTWYLAPGATIKIAASANVPVISVTAASFTLVGQGTLDGNRANQSGGDWTGVGLKATTGDDLTIDGVKIQNCRDQCIVVMANSLMSRVNILGTRLYDAGLSAIHVRGVEGMTFVGNHLYDWGKRTAASPAFSIYLGATVGLHRAAINGNVFDNTVGTLFAIEAAGVWSEIVADSSICGNTFNGNALQGNGISGYFFRTVMSGNAHSNGAGDWRSGYEVVGEDVVIEGNVIEKGMIAIASSTGGTTTRIQALGNIVTNNATNGKGIGVGGSSGALSDIDIDGNTILVTGTGSTHGINVGTYGTAGQVNRVRVRGNTVRDGTNNAAGINLQAAAGSTDIFMSDNVVGGCYQGVYTPADSNHSEVTVTGNDLRGNTLPVSDNHTGGVYRIYGNIEDTGQTGVKRGTGTLSPMDFEGTGSPENVVAAPPGSTYSRRDGGAGTCLYIKESGTSTTGWIAK